MISVKMDSESKVIGFSLSQKGVYPVLENSNKIVVMKVILRGEKCLSGKIANLVFGESVEMKTEKECLCYHEVEAVCNFNLHGIFVLGQTKILSESELTHNLMISISICFCNQTWLEPLPCS